MSKPAGFGFLILVPEIAHAQHIPTWLMLAVLSPFVVFLLAVALGFLTRSLQTGAAHAGMVLFWVLLFVIAANIFVNDYVIWAPLVFFALHAIFVVVQIVMVGIKRFHAVDEDA